MNRSVGLTARRVCQTLTFANGTRVLTDLATVSTPWRRDELVFRTRDGVSIACPNHAGARVPVYEVFVEDSHRLRETVSGPLAGLPEDAVVIDIGAQVGCFSIAVATRCPGATVHAYEASPSTARWLERNVCANGLADRVTPLAVAVSDRYGTLELIDDGPGDRPGDRPGDAPDPSDSPGGRTVSVPCVSLAETVRHAGGRADLVRIDTEGAEYAIVLGSDRADWAGVRRLVLDYHDAPGPGRDDLLAFLADAGLRAIAHRPRGPQTGTLWFSRET